MKKSLTELIGVLGEVQDSLGMLRAIVQRATSTLEQLEIPDVPTHEVTEAERAYILARRLCSTEQDWLRTNGARDQTCVMFNLTKDQVAGILAADTLRKQNGNGQAAK